MSGNSPIHICYYSNRCQWSKAFITELAQTPWKGQFHFICADPSPTRPQLPSWLKKVPTLVLAGDPNPKTDAEVMNWLYEKRMREGVDSSTQNGSAPPGAGGEPDAWNMIEQGIGVGAGRGFSYSGLDADTSTAGDGGRSMPGAFSFLGGAAPSSQNYGGSGFAPAGGVGTKKSKKEELFDKQMEAYSRERDSGVPRFQQRL
jgi:hypothetical protein